MSDSALAIGLQKSGGRAFIALKTPAAPRISETIRDEVVTQGREPVPRGTRSAVSKADLAEGLKTIAALGVTVRQFFDAFAVVDAQVEVSGLAALRADPHVEFIEPVVNDFQLPELPASAATRSAQPLQQP